MPIARPPGTLSPSRPPRGRNELAAVAVAVAAWVGGMANAYADDESEARAAKLFREAEKALSEGNTAEGCSKYAQSLELDALGNTALELGNCYEKLGRTASAFRAFGRAADLAHQEKRSDRESAARSKRNALSSRLPMLTVNLSAAAKAVSGLEVRVSGEVLPADQLGKPWAVDPGDARVVATAAGFAPFETTVAMKASDKKTTEIGELAAAAPEPPAPVPAEMEPSPLPLPAPDAAAPDPEATEPSEIGSAGRVVVEVAATGGLFFVKMDRAALASLDGTPYTFASNTSGEFIAVCGSTNAIAGSGGCQALLDPSASMDVGAEVFVGWAVADGVAVGGRVLAGGNIPGGYFVAGGPAVSARVGPVWLGAGLALGGAQYRANLTGAVGTVPPEYQKANGGEEIMLGLDDLPVIRDTAKVGFLVGGTLEIAAVVVEAPAEGDLDFLRGAMIVGGWPTVTYTFSGVAVAIPIGIGYRFH